VANKQSAIFTFHKVREQGEQGNAEAWRAFLDFYSPLHLHLLALYAPAVESANGVWEKTLVMLSENNFERFRATSRQSEREFLADVRALLLNNAALDAPGDIQQIKGEGESPGITLEKVRKLLEGLPLLHQEILFFKLAGYTDATLELLMRVAPRVAQDSFERLASNYAAALALDHDRCLWPAEWLNLLRDANAAKTDKCPELHQFLRIQDGQVSWYDKEPVEGHVASCLHCLAAWTALREVAYWRRAAPRVPPEVVEQFLPVLPIAPATKPSFLKRVFR
jgi:hypothetical protein